MINLPKYPTTESMLEKMSEEQDRSSRSYLGMSALGHVCDARLWLDFRFASVNNFPAETLCKFADGHYSEAETANRLHAVPHIELQTHNDDGEQIGYSDIGGHLSGHLDGLIKGIIQAPKTMHVWEHKCTDDKYVRALERLIDKKGEKNALEEWNQTYFAQAILYMHKSKCKRHFLTVASSGSRRYVEVRTNAQPKKAKELIARAKYIIASDKMPEKVSDKESYYVCKMCSNSGICHGTDSPLPTCRSCIFSKPEITPQNDARWVCNKHGKSLTVAQQKRGCSDHLLIPSMIEKWATQVDSTDDKVMYESKVNFNYFWNGNGEGLWSSTDIHLLEHKERLGDDLELSFCKKKSGDFSCGI